MQLSQYIACDPFVGTMELPTRLLAHPYREFPYILFRGFLSSQNCDEIVETLAKDDDALPAMVKTTKLGSIVDPSVDKSIRKTRIHTLNEPFLTLYTQAFLAHQGEIERFFNVSLTTATTVQALEYTRGSFYIKHADDSNEVLDELGQTIGYIPVAPLRKITTVLFASSWTENEPKSPYTFSGGELVFNYLTDLRSGERVCLKPKAGDMVVFPSNPIFAHEVLPVLGGFRLSLVQWHNALIH
jgi:SM-20-related protein